MVYVLFVANYSMLIAWFFYYFGYFLVHDLPLAVGDSYKIWDDLNVLDVVVDGTYIARCS